MESKIKMVGKFARLEETDDSQKKRGEANLMTVASY